MANDQQTNKAENEAIRAKLIKAEQSGLTDKTAEEILAEIKDGLRINGQL